MPKHKRKKKSHLGYEDTYRLTKMLVTADKMDQADPDVQRIVKDLEETLEKQPNKDTCEKKYLWENMVPKLKKQCSNFYGDCGVMLRWWWENESYVDDLDLSEVCPAEFQELLHRVYPDEFECDKSDCETCDKPDDS